MTTTIFTFIWTYNDFFSQLLYLDSETNYTVPLGLRLFLDASGQSSWGPMFAMTTLSLVPVFWSSCSSSAAWSKASPRPGLKG